MERWRWMVAAAIVVGLAALVAVLLGGDPTPSTTTIRATAPTTTSTSPSTTAATTTSTVTAEQRQAEVEMILQELWFGWFEAIYNKDANALWEVVATTRFHDSGVVAMDSMAFRSPPSAGSIQMSNLDVLLDRSDCLVAYYSVFPSFLSEPESSVVSVLWPDDRYGWRFATSWLLPSDLWMDDCGELVREETP